MAFARPYLFDPKDQATSFYARAISHPIRLDMLRDLKQSGPVKVADWVKKYPLTPSSISQHLQILRKSQLVLYTEIYPHTIYRIHPENLEKAKGLLGDFLRDI